MMTNETTDALVSVGWVVDRLDEFRRDDPSFRLLEVDIDPSNYDDGHVPGATKVDWKTELQDSTTFDVPTKDDFEALLGGHGIAGDTTVVLYGDMMNWFAAYAYWLLTYYGHDDVRLLNGGRESWLGRDVPVTDEVPQFTAQSYDAPINRTCWTRYRETPRSSTFERRRSTAVKSSRRPDGTRGSNAAATSPARSTSRGAKSWMTRDVSNPKRNSGPSTRRVASTERGRYSPTAVSGSAPP
jgi:3-mercaptopyruvate sulfurtransferase SseA